MVGLGFSASVGVAELRLAEEVDSELQEGRSCGMATPPTSKHAAAGTLSEIADGIGHRISACVCS